MERIPKILDTIDAGLAPASFEDDERIKQEAFNAEIDTWTNYTDQQREQMKWDYRLRGRLPTEMIVAIEGVDE